MTKMFKLSVKDFSNAVIKMFQRAPMNMLETNVKIESFSKEKETLSKELEDVKKNQMEIL